MRKTGLILLVVIFFSACGKSKTDDSDIVTCLAMRPTATLTGVDGRKCACCGGVYITIDGRSEQFRALELPSMTQEELRNLNFPRRIEFDGRKIGECGNEQLVEIRNFVFLP
jgi:hypothetical protein